MVSDFRRVFVCRLVIVVFIWQVWWDFTACDADVCALVSLCGLGGDVCILGLCTLMLVEDLRELGTSLAGGLYGCCLMCWWCNLCWHL